MNEDQLYNDHHLHIDACPCGHVSPEVSGDDVDADVTCEKCLRSTPVCIGTRRAIGYWNKFKNDLAPLKRANKKILTIEIDSEDSFDEEYEWMKRDIPKHFYTFIEDMIGFANTRNLTFNFTFTDKED
jgi:hypothetical protein